MNTKPNTRDGNRIGVAMQPDQMAWLRREAKRNDLTVSQIIRKLVASAMSNNRVRETDRHCDTCGEVLGPAWDRATVHVDAQSGIHCGGKIVE